MGNKRFKSRFAMQRCIFCHGMAADIANICKGCLSDLPRIQKMCTSCALPLADFGICPQCQVDPPVVDGVIAAFRYAFPLSNMVRAAKFSHDFAACNTMGELLAHSLDTVQYEGVDALVPVPLHKWRARKRGFNQSERIAKVTGTVLNIPVFPNAMKRRRATLTQSTLKSKGARIDNVRGAFSVNRLDVGFKNVVIVDDVMTTGATIMECACVIKTACPSATVKAWVVARAAGKD